MWAKLKQWFKNSETIVWARIQMLAGAVVAIWISVSSNPTIDAAIHTVLKPAYVPYYVIACGVLTEYLRRRRATDL